MREKAIEVQNLCIDYRNLQHMSIHQSFNRKNQKKANIVRAVNNVSFSVDEGEILGIVGRNGSGKSTMLKSIAGIFQPDEGTIDIKSHKVSLMSIGVGFKPDITGRENIMTSGMLLGFSPEYAMSKMDEIIEFSELGEFIDKPVRTYSSGMYSKLTFSITAVLDTDIILIDEVLSVGDEKFRKKSFNKMRELILDETRTVIIVSHALDSLYELCTKVLWLHEGKVHMIGKTEEVLAQYEEFMQK